MKKQYMVYAVAGDIGGAKETKLAIDALQRMMPDVQVKWFVDPSPRAQAGEKVLNPVGISYERRMPSADDRADLLVYGASATAFEAQVEWAKWAGSQNIPAIGVNDFYSTINRHPAPSTVITALDEQDAAITRSVRTDVEVVVVGKPSFAQSVRPLIARKNEIRAEVRSKLDIMDNEFMILVSPGSEVEIFSAHLEAVRQTAEKLQSRKVVFVPRAHPKLLALAEGKQCAEQKVAELSANAKVIADSADVVKDLAQVVLASDLMLCTWGSTDQFTAALAGIPVVLFLFPDESAKRKTTGYIDGVPPLIRAHAGWGAATPKQLTEQVDDVLFDPVSARKSVETGAVAFQPLIRPGAAERIAQVIADRLLGF
ncbi:MAG: hypothetical protein A3G03_00400 [Candidatus Taylorbacteria bacterium RIFCSPLOWO2_12_FULL_44_15c]|uniref:Lipid-A-disaccharide synthase n=1 Tax=Candidatus Taylorbacteria bacterium RIFCSPLOWO2_12_FULL_44_15c TaxID=1802333 RepID=A0A1G2P8V2_9BACT|nr:MAG: hypothetical protein A3I97_01345 [Candidatus Taylorbacteria bacterium RIFCSPLOWO2_02_FULL_44_35]OHA44139.1 MAG: hypothetical protein A3G03_00400 [Candidatus Taylorbacteria bacterium RIFCSPLOWO2_12_FULL_44_15c]